MRERCAIFVLPSSTAGQQGPVAAFMSAAGWASAARRVLGASWIVTPEGLVDADDVRHRGSSTSLSPGAAASWRRRVPTPLKTAAKDARQLRRARRFRIDPNGPWRESEISFVWQRHELFHTAGLELARALHAPSVVFAPSTLVWEAEGWGVTRPAWGRWLERVGERPALCGADLVAAGSDDVAEQVQRIGVPASRILVTPTGVDLDLFGSRSDRETERARLGLSERFVVGWVGSFRRFHALELAIDALVDIEDAVLLLVGDGPERHRIEQLAQRAGVSTLCTGTVAHADVVAHLGAMDVALLLAARDEAFHYSPLKLAEYLAAGLPVIAPRVGQIAERLRDGVDAMLVPPGDVPALAGALRTLRDEPELRRRIGTAARELANRTWSWDEQIRRVEARLR
jgi:glycosyltransferase involved in cell wall biosynthesis